MLSVSRQGWTLASSPACVRAFGVSASSRKPIDTIGGTPTKGEALFYQPDFLSAEEQIRAVKIIDSLPFSDKIHRKQQHYGILYYHTSDDRPLIQPSNHMSAEALPLAHFDWLIEKLSMTGLLPVASNKNLTSPDLQILVNEYVARQGISPHFDDPFAFGDTVIGISLLAPITLNLSLPGCFVASARRSISDFTLPSQIEPSPVYLDCLCQASTVAQLNSCQHVPQEFSRSYLLQPGSLYSLYGDSRTRYRHSIRKSWASRCVAPNASKEEKNSYRRLSLTIRRLLPTRKQVSLSSSNNPPRLRGVTGPTIPTS